MNSPPPKKKKLQKFQICWRWRYKFPSSRHNNLEQWKRHSVNSIVIADFSILTNLKRLSSTASKIRMQKCFQPPCISQSSLLEEEEKNVHYFFDLLQRAQIAFISSQGRQSFINLAVFFQSYSFNDSMKRYTVKRKLCSTVTVGFAWADEAEYLFWNWRYLREIFLKSAAKPGTRGCLLEACW